MLPCRTDLTLHARGTVAPRQACSLLYKTRLPVLLVFNKVDVARHEFALDWMADFEAFHQVMVMRLVCSGSSGSSSSSSGSGGGSGSSGSGGSSSAGCGGKPA